MSVPAGSALQQSVVYPPAMAQSLVRSQALPMHLFDRGQLLTTTHAHAHANAHTNAHTLPYRHRYETSRHGVLTTHAHTSHPHSSAPRRSPCLVSALRAHRQEVCGLRWSHNERMLASGGNDNKLFVWVPQLGGAGTARHSSQGVENNPICRFSDHCAAVKAVGWSPHQHGTLASGGGTADRHIRFWNALTGTAMHRIDTGSQVCNLMWSKNVNEIVSTHGYSLNQVGGGWAGCSAVQCSAVETV